jgi:O-antigen ligase/tetratricopeptide (TPR) repeat protein
MKDILRGVVLTGIFLVPFLPLMVADSLFFPFITGKNFAFRILVEVIFASWVVLAFMDRSYRPKFSWILGAFMWFVGIMFVANLMGESPHKSFWSNYERMEGYVALVHLFLYFVVIGSALTTTKLWRAFFATSIGVACLMSLYAFGQIGGALQINQSDTRVDARMGNAAYLAIYMLFHVYLALLLLARASTRGMRIFYGVLAATFVFVLFQTGTRGTALALGGSALLTTGYIALFAKDNPLVRKIAAAGILGVVGLVGLFVLVKDTEFVRSSPNLSRISSISLKEATTRFTIWSLAIEGVKERPILGWGQENFNYVFNKHYKASLYAQEPWFDRVHNLVFDWLIAGGLLGFLAYASIIGTTLFYATVRPLYTRYTDTFTVTERGLILGVLAGYIAHNLLVFDNLISYTLFVAVVAMVHARIASAVPAIEEVEVEDSIVTNIVAPTMLVIMLGTIYLVNIPGILAAGDLIKGFQSSTPEAQYQAFDAALDRGSFGMQEIREQLTRITQTVVQDPNFSSRIAQQYATLSTDDRAKKVNEVRSTFLNRADEELRKQMQETPDDVRILVFQSSFLRVAGKSEEAITVLERAVELSPEKQQTHFELGLALLQAGKTAEALSRFKVAYELEPKNDQARMFYAAAAIYAGDTALRDSLITAEFEPQFIQSDVILRALYDTKRLDELTVVLEKRIEIAPADVQLRVSLAAVKREAGDTQGAIATLEKAVIDFPDFKTQGDQYLEQLRSGLTPQ